MCKNMSHSRPGSVSAKKDKSAHSVKTDFPDKPPRRNSKHSPEPEVPEPEDAMQISISSIEASQNRSHDSSGIAFAKSLSVGSQVARRSQTLTQDMYVLVLHSVIDSLSLSLSVHLGLESS